MYKRLGVLIPGESCFNQVWDRQDAQRHDATPCAFVFPFPHTNVALIKSLWVCQHCIVALFLLRDREMTSGLSTSGFLGHASEVTFYQVGRSSTFSFVPSKPGSSVTTRISEWTHINHCTISSHLWYWCAYHKSSLKISLQSAFFAHPPFPSPPFSLHFYSF